MVVSCVVLNCSTRPDRDDVRFFRIPKISNGKGPHLDILQRQRQAAWLKALKLGPMSETAIRNAKVCSRHFISGAPAPLLNKFSSDWIPTQNMGYTSDSDQNMLEDERETILIIGNEPPDLVQDCSVGESDEEKTFLSQSASSGVTIASNGTPVLGNSGFAAISGLDQDDSLDKTSVSKNSSSPQPQLVIVLDTNYGLNDDPQDPDNYADSTPMKFINLHNTTTDYKGSNIHSGSRATVINNTSYSNTENNLNNGQTIQIFTTSSRRCRSCLKNQPSSNCTSLTSTCYMDKSVKEAICRLIPTINFPLQDSDVVCGNCFKILKESLEFATMFMNAENILESEYRNKMRDATHVNSLTNTPSEFARLTDGTVLALNDRIISLSKIDNNNLLTFVDTLRSNQVEIFQYQSNPYSRKRVLLLGNPKLRRCHVCFEKFLSEVQLQDHLNNEHQITKEYLVKPIRHVSASEENPLTCRACNKTFLSEYNLLSHMKYCISFPCPHCEDHKPFACDKLVEHTKTVHGDEFPFKCCKCKQAVNDYQLHVKHSCVGHVCTKCGKRYQSMDALTYHADKHKDVPCNVPFKTCPTCKQLLRLEDYSSHMAGHKNFVCSKCGMRFYKSKTLEEHEKLHVRGQKMLKCNSCGKFFNKKETLEKHRDSEMCQGSKQQTCEICSETFSSIRSLRHHIANSHGDPKVACELCGKECRPERLKLHMKFKHSKHDFQCQLCSKTFMHFSFYKSHMETHILQQEIPEVPKVSPKKIYSRQEIEKMLTEHEDDMEQEDSAEFDNEESIEDLLIDPDETEEGVEESIPEEDVSKGFTNNGETHHSSKRRKVNIAPLKGPFTCKHCLESFNDQQLLVVHVQTHFQSQNESCSHCNLKFPNRSARMRHERTHKAPLYRFRCNICWRIMNNQEELDNHVKTHTNIFSCDKCDEMFAHQWQLDGHYTSHHEKSPEQEEICVKVDNT